MSGASAATSPWDALVAHLEARYPPFHRRAAGVLFTCAAPPARTIEIGAHASSRVGDVPWLAIATTVCPARLLRARCGMIAMTDLPMGALAIDGDVALFTHTMPLGAFDARTFDETVRVFVEIARELIDAQGFVEVEDPDAPLAPNDARFAYLYW